MPQSLSIIERGNPPPRRKSCAACIKAKRRCDLRQPSCLRCSQRKIDCCYPPRVEATSRKHSDAASCPAQMSSSVQSQQLMKEPLPEMAPWETSFDFNMDLSPSYHPSCPTFPTFSFNEPTFEDLNFLDEIVSVDDTSHAIVPPTPGPTSAIEDPMPMVLRSPNASLTRMQLLRAASELIEKRLRYAIDTFKHAPEKMVLEGGTPWSHPALYHDSMPGFLEDALAACGLHRAKNTINTSLIQRVIELRYQKLLAAPIPTLSAQDVMARTHALLLYQIMLFFNDSPAARALAGETISALADSAMALMQFVHHEPEDEENDNSSNPSRNIPLYPLTAARALYADWTFQESVRRTMLMSFLFVQLQCVMRADFSNPITQLHPPITTDCLSAPSLEASAIAAIKLALQKSRSDDPTRCDSRLLLCQSLTLSAHLWRARDPVEFAVAWREKKHLVAEPWNIWKRLESAQPDDVDELGRILMCAGVGIEETKGWFAAKGGTM
ncbi:hypothetical protein HD806DRAFT_204875 [Xylariaceae sp. AK1471]|nr:hypothetical protein HD806DRAFT_204875 [Xylariaceae sp. AK1471]